MLGEGSIMIRRWNLKFRNDLLLFRLGSRGFLFLLLQSVLLVQLDLDLLRNRSSKGIVSAKGKRQDVRNQINKSTYDEEEKYAKIVCE